MTNDILQELLVKLWGSTVKPFNVPTNPRINEHLDLSLLSNENLIYLVDIFLHASSSNMSGFSVDFDNYDILREVMIRIHNITAGSRRRDPVLCCYQILFTQSWETRGQFSLATMYIIAEIEYLLKDKCSHLNIDGKITVELPVLLRDQLSSSQYKVGKQISQIGDIIKIYCFENDSPFSNYLKEFDSKATVYYEELLSDCSNEVDGVKIPVVYEHVKLIERVNASRNLIMHGEKPYFGCEIFFFLSLHAIFFLNFPDIYAD